MAVTHMSNCGMITLNNAYMELRFLRNILISGDSDIESSADILAICTRIAQLEKELNNAESI